MTATRSHIQQLGENRMESRSLGRPAYFARKR